MSLFNFISNLLDIKDPHIQYDKNCCREESLRGVKAKVIHATLSYIPPACPHCGHIKGKEIIKHGFKSSLITLLNVSGCHAVFGNEKLHFLAVMNTKKLYY